MPVFAQLGEHYLKKLQAVLDERIVGHCEYLHRVLDDIGEKLLEFDELGLLDEFP